LRSWLERYGAPALLACAFTAALALEVFAPEKRTAIFLASIVAIVPLAGYIGRATDTLSVHLGGSIGGLLNATFGNIA
jgi:Ca2+:H+ antiporter